MFRNSSTFGFKRDMHLAYRTGDVIGSGGKGVVRRVVDHGGNEFACKTIPSEARIPVWKEVVAMRTMEGCPLVAQLVDVYEDSSHVHIVSELCRGGSIEGKAASEEHARAYVVQILRAISAMHSSGLMHGDIKPENFVRVVDTEDVNIKAIDFGISEPLPVITTELKGTLWYMAPEMFSSQVGAEVDVWAAGVSAVELLTGHLPFNDKHNTRCPAVQSVIRSILLDRFVPGEDELTGAARDFLEATLVKDPKKRPSADELLSHPWLSSYCSPSDCA